MLINHAAATSCRNLFPLRSIGRSSNCMPGNSQAHRAVRFSSCQHSFVGICDQARHIVVERARFVEPVGDQQDNGNRQATKLSVHTTGKTSSPRIWVLRPRAQCFGSSAVYPFLADWAQDMGPPRATLLLLHAMGLEGWQHSPHGNSKGIRQVHRRLAQCN